VGPKFHVNHGTSIALVLPAVAKFNFASQMEKYRSIAEAMDFDTRSTPLADVGELVVSAIKNLMRDIGMTETLKDMNPSKDDLEDIARDSFEAYKAHYNQKNPSKMLPSDYMKILEDCC
jgi:alcohol dehydrogenase